MKKRMLSLLLAVALVLGLCPGVFAAGSSYADVLDTHWAHPYIEDVTEKGIMNGVDDVVDGTENVVDDMTNGTTNTNNGTTNQTTR